MAGRDGEIEPGSVADTGRYGDLQRMAQQLEAAATAQQTCLRPRLAAPAAFTARAVHRHVERKRGAARSLALGQLDRGPERLRTLVGQERLPHTFDRRRGRRKVDAHLVREAV